MRRAIALLLVLPLTGGARKFYDDDPLQREPPPRRVKQAAERELSDYYDFILYTFKNPSEKQPKPEKGVVIPARGVNTLDEALDSAWFTNRIGARPMSVEEIRRGPRRDRPPTPNGQWTILASKSQGVTPGFLIRDEEGRRYVLKFDPPLNPEMASGADVLGSLFFHALGYNVPENYIVEFFTDNLIVGPNATTTDITGKERAMTLADVDAILSNVRRGVDGRVRALASLFLDGQPLGAFRYHGTRSDDPNDTIPHEHRRDLRGMFVFSAWLAHDDSRAINTLDMLVEEGGLRYIKHHLIDFGSILGSASDKANPVRGGGARLFEWKPALTQMLLLGAYVPKWARIKYPEYASIGRIEYEHFHPEEWRGEYRNPAFQNRLPDDTFWAAKKVMAFTDEQIRAIVAEGRYSDPEAAEYLARCLIERRDRVGREYFSRVLPLDGFAIKQGRLVWEDLEVVHGLAEAREVSVNWRRFDNRSESDEPIDGASGAALPPEVQKAGEGEYFLARLKSNDAGKSTLVYLRKNAQSLQVVGVERGWPERPL